MGCGLDLNYGSFSLIIALGRRRSREKLSA